MNTTPLIQINKRISTNELVGYIPSKEHTIFYRDPENDVERQYVSTINRLESKVYNPDEDKDLVSLERKSSVLSKVVVGVAALDAVVFTVMIFQGILG